MSSKKLIYNIHHQTPMLSIGFYNLAAAFVPKMISMHRCFSKFQKSTVYCSRFENDIQLLMWEK